MTRAGHYIQTQGKGAWRTAKKAHVCDAYFERPCVGNGEIAAGERYFDTQELRESFTTYRSCQACATVEVKTVSV